MGHSLRFKSLSDLPLHHRKQQTPAVVAKAKPVNKAPEPLEEEIQGAYFDLVRMHYGKYPALRFMFAVPNGGHRDAAVAGKMKATGTVAGVPDVMWPHASSGFAGFAIEFKRRAGMQPSTEQQSFIEHLIAQNWHVQVHHDPEQAWNVTQRYYLGKL